MKLGIIGAGWAGLAAAVHAVDAGHTVKLFEASAQAGGRARALTGKLPDGSPARLDNGQHILIGAYRDTLALLRRVGVDPDAALLRLPLALKFPDGSGLQFPHLPAPFDALIGITGAKGWGVREKWSLLRVAAQWRRDGFACAPHVTVSGLCTGLAARVVRELVEPLCVSALNTPAHKASGQVFLRVMRDSLLGAPGDSNLLLPRVDLSALFPDAASDWLTRCGAELALGSRVYAIKTRASQWEIDGCVFDHVLLATGAPDAVRILTTSGQSAMRNLGRDIDAWCATASALQHAAIATVYAWRADARLESPMLALRSREPSAPAQFVFDRGLLGGPAGLLAFVVSDSDGAREQLQSRVIAQARAQLGLDLLPIQTVIEKRATFACTPSLLRPPMQIAPGLLACGDYVQGPYPSTLEGAVRAGRSAVAAVAALRQSATA